MNQKVKELVERYCDVCDKDKHGSYCERLCPTYKKLLKVGLKKES